MKTVEECATLLGEAIAQDAAVLAFNGAKAAFENDKELTGMLQRISDKVLKKVYQ